jgi:hypothetical protein
VRSIVHLLNVFATRLEIDNGPKDAVKAIKLFATDRTIRRAEHRDWNADEEKRVEQQRTLFGMLPSCNPTDRLKAAMLQRAYNLLWDGDCMGCDAIAEFIPSRDIDKMFACWSSDFDGAEPRSEFYKGNDK